MTRRPPAPAALAGPSAPGQSASDPGLARLAGVLDLARAWAGEDRLALILSGSHAGGGAVWVRHAQATVSLSDLDLYAVVPDRGSLRAAAARAAAARPGLTARLRSLGLAAPLEVGFHTPEDLGRLPARPGTLELRRRGRVVEGDPSWRDRVPAWQARDVDAEEVLRLLENRAFELLWAEHLPGGTTGLPALARRHAVLKCALDLATVMALEAGEYPETAAARVAWARPRWDHARAPEPPWQAALAWRERAAPLAAAEAEAERVRTVRGWVAVWRALTRDPGDPRQPFGPVLRLARRARLRRRVREAVRPEAHLRRLRPPGGRIRRALAGTPRHRLHAAAAAHLLFAAARADASAAGGTVPDGLRLDFERTLRALGFPGSGPGSGARLVMAWDRGLLDGQRTEDWT